MSSGSRDAILAELGREVRGWQVDQEMFDSAVATLAGLNRTDWRCLDILFTRGAMTAGQLASVAHLTTGAVTGILDHLEAAGMVRRVRDTVDRRRVIIEMVPGFERRAMEVYGPFVAEGDAFLASFGDDELVAVTRFVRGSRELLQRHTKRIRDLVDGREATVEAS